MIVQLVTQLISVIIAGFLAYLAYSLGTAVKFCTTGMLGELCWLLPDTPALNEFIMFVLQSVIAVTALACKLLQVSNHIVLSLDILYFLSLSILILYHMLKEAGTLRLS